jgi:hypothetical protein
LTGAHPGGDAPAAVREIAWEADRGERLWRAHRRELIAEAKRQAFSPFALWLFEGTSLPGLRQWRQHALDPRKFLRDSPVLQPCLHCGGRDPRPPSCLSEVV